MTHTRVLLVLSVVVCCAGLIVPGSRQRGPSIRPARPSSTEPELEPEPEPEPLDGSEDELAMDGDEEANEAAEAEADAAKAAARTRRVPRDPSIEEFEARWRGLIDRIGIVSGRARQLFLGHRHLALAAGGLLGLSHGGALAFTVLFAQSFGVSGWPLVRDGLRRGANAYEAAKDLQPRETSEYSEQVAPLRTELVALAAELSALRRDEADEAQQRAVLARMRQTRANLEAVPRKRRAAPVLVAACDPVVVKDVALGVWSGVTVSLAAACSSAARTIGVGVTLGEAVSRVATSCLSLAEPAMRRAVSSLPAEAVMLSYLGPSLLGLGTLNLLGRSIGCFIAYKLQRLAAVLSVSLLSSRALVDGIDGMRKAYGDPIAHANAQPGAAPLAFLHIPSSFRAGFLPKGAFAKKPPPRRARPPAASAAGAAAGGVDAADGSAAPAEEAEEVEADEEQPLLVGRKEAVIWLLAIASLQSQRARGFRLPWPLRVTFLPLLGVEALLHKLANRMTSAGFPGLGLAGGLVAPLAGVPR